MAALTTHRRHEPRERRALGRATLSLVVLLLTTVTLAERAAAAGAPHSEHEVKAAYLFNFANFVEWPASTFTRSDAPLSICVLGADPFGTVLDATLADERVGGRALVTRRLRGFHEAEGCQIVFVPAAEHEHLSALISALDARPVLTVGESDGFAREGGMIGFLLQDGTVRFEVNVAAVEHAGLKVSAHLLNLARRVETRQEARP